MRGPRLQSPPPRDDRPPDADPAQRLSLDPGATLALLACLPVLSLALAQFDAGLAGTMAMASAALGGLWALIVALANAALGRGRAAVQILAGLALFLAVQLTVPAWLAATTARLSPASDPAARITSTPPPADTPTPLPAQMPGRVTGDMLNLRSGPGTFYSTILKLRRGNMLRVVGRDQDATWLRVEWPPGEYNWVAAEFIELPAAPWGLPVFEEP
jgi:hypothetical protein